MASHSTEEFVARCREYLRQLEVELSPVVAPVSAADGLPSFYKAFLQHIGAGSIRGSFQVYGGLVNPDEIYDAEKAKALQGLLLFGDDYQGYCVALDPSRRWKVVEIDDTSNNTEVVAEGFGEFMLELLQDFSKDLASK